jgi:mRNA interferase MazF
MAQLPHPIGRHPVLLVTRSAAIAVWTTVTVAPITRSRRGIGSEVPLGKPHGIRDASVANCDSLMTIPKQAIRRQKLGSLSTDELPALDHALTYALGIRG